MHYPSKQTIIIFFVCLAAIAGMAIYVDRNSPTKPETTNTQPSVFAKAQDMFENSPIGTSTEWKKAFLETGASSTSFKTPVKVAPVNTDDTLTATNKFGRGLFSQYVSLKQVGLMNDPTIVSSTISSLLAQSYSNSDMPKEYSLSDIHINPDTSVEALKQYGNVTGTLFATNAPLKDDATLALAGMQKKDPNYKEELDANIVKYKTVLARLLTILVPKSVSSYHLNIINGTSQMIYIASALQVSESDPMRAMGGLKMYGTAFPLVIQNMTMLRNALGVSGITYLPNEGGSFYKLIIQ